MVLETDGAEDEPTFRGNSRDQVVDDEEDDAVVDGTRVDMDNDDNNTIDENSESIFDENMSGRQRVDEDGNLLQVV